MDKVFSLHLGVSPWERAWRLTFAADSASKSISILTFAYEFWAFPLTFTGKPIDIRHRHLQTSELTFLHALTINTLCGSTEKVTEEMVVRVARDEDMEHVTGRRKRRKKKHFNSKLQTRLTADEQHAGWWVGWECGDRMGWGGWVEKAQGVFVMLLKEYDVCEWPPPLLHSRSLVQAWDRNICGA